MEDEELCLIEKNAHKHSEVLLSASLSPVVPLPSPPVNILNEIIPTDESLPSPPASPVTITTNKLTKREEKPEVIYENLEMLNIKCSVVNSSTQTSEPDTSADKPSVQPDKLNDSAFPNKLKNSCMEKTKVQNLCSVASASTKSPIDKFANDRRILSLPLTSAYFTTSEPKAKLLTRYISNLHQDNIPVGRELGSKKEELMASITKKLDILRLEQVALKEEMKQNDELGNTLATKVELSAKPNETEKFRLHVEELEKITNLMLSLSGRLARAENALLILPADITSAEKNVLEMKYSTLKEQYEEAKYLKKNIDRRNCQISLFLRKYFTEDEFADYDHFIKMKAKLLMDDRELDEKIKLGEEQLTALKNSLNTQALRQLKNSSSNLQ